MLELKTLHKLIWGLLVLTSQGVYVGTHGAHVTASSFLKNFPFSTSQTKDLFPASGESEDSILEPWCLTCGL